MAIRWRIALFGVLRAEGDGRVVTRFRRQKTGVLLAYLAYHPSRSHLRDALIELPGQPQKVGPSSTVTGAAIVNAIVARTAELLLQRTGDMPVFMSANLDGGDEHNRRWLEHYKGRLTYL